MLIPRENLVADGACSLCGNPDAYSEKSLLPADGARSL